MTKYKLSLLLAALQCAALAAHLIRPIPVPLSPALKIGGTEIGRGRARSPGQEFFSRRFPSIGPLPAHCRVDGVLRFAARAETSVEFGIGFALALPEKGAWNGDS